MVVFIRWFKILAVLFLFSVASPVYASPSLSEQGYVSVITRYITTVSGTANGTANYIARCIVRSCKRNNVDPLLLTSLISQESTFHPNAQSSSGAMGLGQLMPATAQSVGVVNPWDIADNIEGSARYFSQMLVQFSGWDNPVSYALAAYNAGPNAVRSYGGVPPYTETENYVKKVSRNYSLLKSLI